MYQNFIEISVPFFQKNDNDDKNNDNNNDKNSL